VSCPAHEKQALWASGLNKSVKLRVHLSPNCEWAILLSLRLEKLVMVGTVSETFCVAVMHIPSAKVFCLENSRDSETRRLLPGVFLLDFEVDDSDHLVCCGDGACGGCPLLHGFAYKKGRFAALPVHALTKRFLRDVDCASFYCDSDAGFVAAPVRMTETTSDGLGLLDAYEVITPSKWPRLTEIKPENAHRQHLLRMKTAPQ
jgi:hypothetical protein